MNYDDDKTREEEEKKERELAALIALGVLLYSDQETEILNIIAAHLSADDFDGDLNKWRSAHLAQGRIVEKEVRGVIGSYSQAEREVFNAVIDQSAVNAVRRVDVPLQSAGIPAAAGASGTASKAAKYFRDQAKHDINTCNTVMRYMSKKGYTAAVNSAFYNAKQSERIWKALGEGALSVAEGRDSLQAAVRSTIMNMSRDGIPAFIDKAGREWSPEAYVRMDLRTTAANTARQATFERCAENDINLIEVDAHSGARPLCAPWQGRIYSLDGTSGTVKDGSGREFNYIPLTSTSYGQAAGLFGINCGHRPYPFRPGVNFKTWQPLSSDEDFDRNSKRYKQFQKQRAMERRIRADKRDCMMCNAAGDKQGFTEASQRLKRSREKYAAYCKNTGLKQHNDRTQVYGFDRSVSAKAVWADRKAKISPSGLTSGGGSGTISSEHKMSAFKNDWSKATPQNHSAEELQQISDYAKSKGIKIYAINSFDGDTEMLKRHIDNISNLAEQYNIKKTITITFKTMSDEDFAATLNTTITFNKKALRSIEVTNSNLQADNTLSANSFIGISSHEMGHIVAQTYGEKGIELAKQAYYNAFGEEISTDDILAYLLNDVSIYSVTTNPMTRKTVYKEIIPEILSKHTSGASDEFTDEFILLLKGMIK